MSAVPLPGLGDLAVRPSGMARIADLLEKHVDCDALAHLAGCR